jgi:hypothetical protein
LAPLLFAVGKKKNSRAKPEKKSKAPKSPSRAPKATPARTKGKVARRQQPKPVPAKSSNARHDAGEKPVEPFAPPPKPQAPISAPGVFSPRGNQAVESLTPSFRWFYVGGATRYEVAWSQDVHFHKANTLISDQTAAFLDAEHALLPGATYVWRVRGGNEGGWGPWSEAASFSAPEE